MSRCPTRPVCAHNLLDVPDGKYVRMLTGHRLDSDLICRACDRMAGQGREVELVVVCEGCVARCIGDGWSGLVGWRGTPEIVDRPEPLDAAVVEVPLSVAVADLHPRDAAPRAC
jgi:hypothetical protein